MIVYFFLFVKISTVLLFFFSMPALFDQSIFKYNDLSYYTSGDLGIGPNIGYRWLIWILGINTIDEIIPIFLALIINLLIDVAWIYLLSKYINLRSLLIFAIMLGVQPYSAIYTIKFSTIIFAKIGVFLFCKELFEGGFNNIKNKTLSMFDLASWTVLTMLRNSNLFIAAPYIFLKLINRPIFAVLVTFIFVGVFYILSIGYLEPLMASDRPWTLNYVKEFFGVKNNFFALPLLFVARVLMLFGSREKVYGEGLEPFIIWGMPGIELCIYILLAFVQLFGFFIAIRYLLKKYGITSLVLLIPLILAIFTVTHQRYLIPFIPLCLFGLSLIFEKFLRNFNK